MSKKLSSQLLKITQTISQWDLELKEYTEWAKSNDGIVDDQEQAEINRRMADIQQIQEKIDQLQQEQALNDLPQSLSPAWEKALAVALLPVEIKLKLKSFLEPAYRSEEDDKAHCTLINDVVQYYEVNIRNQQEERINKASKAALAVSLDNQKEKWTANDAHKLFKEYYYKDVKFEEVEFSAPSQQVGVNNLSKVAQNLGNTPPTIIVPLKSENLKTFKNGASVDFGASIKITFKKEAILSEKDRIESEAKSWAIEAGASWFNSTVSATLKNSTSTLDIDVIKAQWKPVSAKVSISGPKVQNDLKNMDFSLATIAISGELKDASGILTNMPPEIASISISFRLALSKKVNFLDKAESKALQLLRQAEIKKNDRIASHSANSKKEADLRKELEQLKKDGFDSKSPKEYKKKVKAWEKAQKQLEKGQKILDKADKAIDRIQKKITSKGGQIIARNMGKGAAKLAAKVVGRFIPGVNVALLIWDGIEIGMMVYKWYNAKDPAEVMLEAIEKMPERTKIFLKAIIKKYNTIPDCGDDIDDLSLFLDGLSQEDFDRLIERIPEAEFRFKAKSGNKSAGLSSKFFAQLEKLAEPEFEISEEELIQNMMRQTPSVHVKSKGTFIRLPQNYSIGDKVPATLLADFNDDDGKFIRSLTLSNIGMQYDILGQKGDILEVTLVTESDGNFWFKVADITDLYIPGGGTRYWHTIEGRWVHESLYTD